MLWDSFSSVLNERYCNKNKCQDSDLFSCFIYGLVTDSFAQYLWRRICQVVFSSTFPYHTHNKPNANKKKKPLFSFRLKLINPMTRAKVSNQGGTVNWCISLSDCSCNKRVQSQKVQRQNCLHLSSSARPWNYLHQSNFLAIKIFFFHSTFYMVSNWSFSLK